MVVLFFNQFPLFAGRLFKSKIHAKPFSGMVD